MRHIVYGPLTRAEVTYTRLHRALNVLAEAQQAHADLCASLSTVWRILVQVGLDTSDLDAQQAQVEPITLEDIETALREATRELEAGNG